MSSKGIPVVSISSLDFDNIARMVVSCEWM